MPIERELFEDRLKSKNQRATSQRRATASPTSNITNNSGSTHLAPFACLLAPPLLTSCRHQLVRELLRYTVSKHCAIAVLVVLKSRCWRLVFYAVRDEFSPKEAHEWATVPHNRNIISSISICRRAVSQEIPHSSPDTPAGYDFRVARR
jgi:hypothetical protein